MLNILVRALAHEEITGEEALRVIYKSTLTGVGDLWKHIRRGEIGDFMDGLMPDGVPPVPTAIYDAAEHEAYLIRVKGIMRGSRWRFRNG